MNDTLQTTLRLWTYDVLGNEMDGYDVNDRCNSQTEVIDGDIPALHRDAEDLLAEVFQFGPQVRIDWTQGDEWTYELVNSQTGMPLGQITVGE